MSMQLHLGLNSHPNLGTFLRTFFALFFELSSHFLRTFLRNFFVGLRSRVTTPKKCNNSACGNAGRKRCSQCKSVYYCDENCQRNDWKKHRPTCQSIKEQLNDSDRKHEASRETEDRNAVKEASGVSPDLSSRPPPPAFWANGLDSEKQRVWLVDCYRMRLSDEHAYRGNIRRGTLYSCECSPGEVVHDFLVFCRLAHSGGVLPEAWDWNAFLTTAAHLLQFDFQRSDATEKYGSDNHLNGVLQGKRSLWYTGEVIYGSDVMDHTESKLRQKLQKEILNKKRTADMVAGVGGKEPWDTLDMKLKDSTYLM